MIDATTQHQRGTKERENDWEYIAINSKGAGIFFEHSELFEQILRLY